MKKYKWRLKIGIFYIVFFLSHTKFVCISHSFFKAISKTFYLLFSLSVRMGEWNARMCEQDKSKLFLIEEVYEMPEMWTRQKSKLFNTRGVYIYMSKLSLLFYWAHKYIFQFYIYEWKTRKVRLFPFLFQFYGTCLVPCVFSFTCLLAKEMVFYLKKCWLYCHGILSLQ